MNPRPFPTVAAYPLPASALRAPIVSQEPTSPPGPAQQPEATDSDQDVTARVSAAIARAVRQRRYTG
ncbi:MAG: hypothetical protein IJE07_12190 [Clostridia bacterium]|nr:hypothetical protein [Clostridia bacterium]